MMRRRKKPRDWAAELVRGAIAIDEVPENLQIWVEWHIAAIAEHLAAERKRKGERQ